MEITYLGHSGFVLSFGSARVLIDPFLNPKCSGDLKTLVKCPVSKDDLNNISLILLTHEHFDHFEPKVVEHIATRNNAVVVAHDSLLSQMKLPRNLVRAISVGQAESLRGIEVEAMPAHHPNSFYPLSYIIRANGKSVFHAGDTALTDSISEVKADVALLPIGGTYTMDLTDAVRATKTMKPSLVIPMHYNTFAEIKADPQEFKQRIEKSILKTRVVVLEPGKSCRY